MADQTNDAAHAWQLMKKIGFPMLVTATGNKMRSRPMAAHFAAEDNEIYFLSDVRAWKDDEIERNPNVNLAFADSNGQKYVSVSGHASVSNDRAKISELFSTAAKAWWKDENDPNIRVLKIVPDEAEFWDSPGTVVSYVKMAAAAVTGTRPSIGENRKVAM